MSDKKTKGLKLCPFCGCGAKLWQGWDGTWIVQCLVCACGTLHFVDKNDAVQRWNRRAYEKLQKKADSKGL